MLGQLTEVMSMDDVQVLYPKERIMLYGINSNCELFLPIARSSFPSYFPFCFCSLLLQRRAVAALLSPGEVHGVVLCIALVFLSFLRFLLYSVDWTSVGHSLRCGSLGLETSTLNSFARVHCPNLVLFYFILEVFSHPKSSIGRKPLITASQVL